MISVQVHPAGAKPATNAAGRQAVSVPVTLELKRSGRCLDGSLVVFPSLTEVPDDILRLLLAELTVHAPKEYLGHLWAKGARS